LATAKNCRRRAAPGSPHFRINCQQNLALGSVIASGRSSVTPAVCQWPAGESKLIIDIADRYDARRDRGIAWNVEKDLHLRQPVGAPRHANDRRAGEHQRIAAAGSESQPSCINAPISVGRWPTPN
jgi:hypothetical protein